MPDAGIEILKTNIGFNDCRRAVHGANAATHIAIANVGHDPRRHLAAFRPRNADARVTDVMHDVIFHHTRMPHLNTCCTGLADVLVFLVVALSGMMFLPFHLIVPAHPRDREAIQYRPFGHQHARAHAFPVIENRHLCTSQAQFTFGRIPGASNIDARFEP